MPTDRTPDPAVVAAVDEVTNRFGLEGLDAMLELATERRADAQQALDALGELAAD